jgi:hypothetical protein
MFFFFWCGITTKQKQALTEKCEKNIKRQNGILRNAVKIAIKKYKTECAADIYWLKHNLAKRGGGK